MASDQVNVVVMIYNLCHYLTLKEILRFMILQLREGLLKRIKIGNTNFSYITEKKGRQTAMWHIKRPILGTLIATEHTLNSYFTFTSCKS